MKLVPLSRERHAALRLRPPSSFLDAGKTPVISLYGSELARAAHEFPIVFTAEPEGYFPAAILGLDVGQNLFVDQQGRWLAGYVPAVWRRGAFRLAKLNGDVGEWVLCIDEDSDLLGEAEGTPLFKQGGEPEPVVEQATQFLSGLERDRITTLAACAALDRLGLITPWELTVNRPNGTPQRIGGLHRVEEARIAGLSGEALAELNRTGALAVIYAHLLSLHKLSALGRLGGAREEENKRRDAVQQGKLNLDQVFGIVEDDPFIF